MFVFFQRGGAVSGQDRPRRRHRAGGSCSGCGCATPSSRCFPSTTSCSGPIRSCTSGRGSRPSRWVRRHRPSPTSPAPPRPAPPTFDGAPGPVPAGTAQCLRAYAPRRRPGPGADSALAGLWGLSGAIRRMAPPPDTDRSIALTVADRRVVAHDQDVIALTLAASGDAAALASRRAHRHPPAQRAGAAVLAVRRSRRTRPLPHRRSADSDGGGGSLEMHDLAIGATRHDPRPAQRVPAHGARIRIARPPVPLHRRRHRHHADPADAGAWRSGRGVDWSMVYAGRSRDSLPFVDEVGRVRRPHRGPHRRRQRSADGRRTARRLPRRHRGLRVRSCADADRACAPRSPGRDDVELHFERFAAPPVVDGTRVHGRCGVDRRDGPGRCGGDPACGAEPGRACTRRTPVSRASAAPAAPGCSTGAVDHRDTLLTDPERDDGTDADLRLPGRRRLASDARSVAGVCTIRPCRWPMVRRSLATPSCGCSAPAAWVRSTWPSIRGCPARTR